MTWAQLFLLAGAILVGAYLVAERLRKVGQSLERLYGEEDELDSEAQSIEAGSGLAAIGSRLLQIEYTLDRLADEVSGRAKEEREQLRGVLGQAETEIAKDDNAG